MKIQLENKTKILKLLDNSDVKNQQLGCKLAESQGWSKSDIIIAVLNSNNGWKKGDSFYDYFDDYQKDFLNYQIAISQDPSHSFFNFYLSCKTSEKWHTDVIYNTQGNLTKNDILDISNIIF